MNNKEKIQHYLNNPYVQSNSSWTYELQVLKERLEDNEFRIVFCGEFSSGKSTVINALVGQDVLTHGSKEISANITEIRRTPNLKTPQVEVIDSKNQVKKLASIDELVDYTTTISKKFNVSEDIKLVSVKGDFQEIYPNVVLVDTPGLNGIADKHRELTYDQVKRAHSCAYVLQARGLADSDINELRTIAKYQKKILIIQNFIDQLKSDEGETTAEKLANIKHVLDQQLNVDGELDIQVVGVSALKALTSKDKTIKSLYQDDMTELTIESRKQLFKESGFSDFEKIVETMSAPENIKKAKEKVIKRALQNLEREMKQTAQAELDDNKRMIELSKGKDKLNVINYRYEELRNGIEKDHTDLKNFILARRKEAISDLHGELNETIEQIDKEFVETLNKEKDYYVFKKENEKKTYSKQLEGAVYDLNSNVLKDAKIYTMNIYDNALERVNTMLKTDEKAKKESVSLNVPKQEPQAFENERGYVEILKEDITEQEAAKDKAARDLNKNKLEMNAIKNQKESEELKKRQARENQRHGEITNYGLGVKPSSETKHETVYVDRGGFGILDALLGPKKETRSYQDNSNVVAWENKLKNLRQDAQNVVADKERQIENLESQLDDLEGEMNRNAKNVSIHQDEIKEDKERLKNAIDDLHELELENRRALLKAMKTHLLEGKDNYLSEFKEQQTANIRELMTSWTNRVTQQVIEKYDVDVKNKIKTVKNILDTNSDAVYKHQDELQKFIETIGA